MSTTCNILQELTLGHLTALDQTDPGATAMHADLWMHLRTSFQSISTGCYDGGMAWLGMTNMTSTLTCNQRYRFKCYLMAVQGSEGNGGPALCNWCSPNWLTRTMQCQVSSACAAVLKLM